MASETSGSEGSGFTADEVMQRNSAWSIKRPSYQTALTPTQEAAFRGWVASQKIPFDPNDARADYDMRGFWLANRNGDRRASTAIDPNDQQIHYPDVWKTPYSATFSAESMYSSHGAPTWKDDKLMLPDGTVLYDDKARKWYPVKRAPEKGAGK